MAHPLNRPLYDAALGRVVDGYGILQPRVAISLPGSSRSRYARLYGGATYETLRSAYDPQGRLPDMWTKTVARG